MTEVAGRFVFRERRLNVCGQLLSQASRLGDELWDAGRRIREDRGLDPRRFREQVFDREKASVGLSEEMDRIESQMRPQLVDFLRGALDRPETPVVGLVRLSAAELVIEDDRSDRGKLGQVFQVVVSRAGSAVEE